MTHTTISISNVEGFVEKLSEEEAKELLIESLQAVHEMKEGLKVVQLNLEDLKTVELSKVRTTSVDLAERAAQRELQKAKRSLDGRRNEA